MNENRYSEIKTVTLPKRKIARYVMISPNPEDDVISYMLRWAEASGLTKAVKDPERIGWDFPFVTKEQQEQFGLRGYVCAYLIPESFEPKCCGAELAYLNEDTYATLTITDPHSNSFENIPYAYRMLLDYSQTSSWENRIAFEKEYDVDGVHYMDVYVPYR